MPLVEPHKWWGFRIAKGGRPCTADSIINYYCSVFRIRFAAQGVLTARRECRISPVRAPSPGALVGPETSYAGCCVCFSSECSRWLRWIAVQQCTMCRRCRNKNQAMYNARREEGVISAVTPFTVFYRPVFRLLVL